MTRTMLAVFFAITMLVGISAQAGDRNWHQHKSAKGHQYNHNGGHYDIHGGRRYICWNRNHKHYRGQVQFYTIPLVGSGTRYGYSAAGEVMVYKTYSLNSHRPGSR